MKFTWLAAAAALAGWLIARRHKQQRWFQIAELVVIAGALLIGFGVVQLPNFLLLAAHAVFQRSPPQAEVRRELFIPC